MEVDFIAKVKYLQEEGVNPQVDVGPRAKGVEL